MQLELAIVQTCTSTGCRVRFLQGSRELDTRYSLQIIRYEVDIRPGDLVVVDTSVNPPCTVFCFARSQVERVEINVHTDRDTKPQTPAEGLEDTLEPGDWVFTTWGQIYDRCVDGLPADPDRLWSKARPFIEPRAQSATPAPEPEPAQAIHTSGPPQVEYLTAETERGRQALQAVMDRSYSANYEGSAPEWTLVRLVDGVPVSFIVVVPNLELDMGNAACSAGIPYAFVNDVATRMDRRREGHFRALMEHTYELLRQAGYSLILLHGRYPLYRALDFEVFTHHCGIFITPEQIERALGPGEEVNDPKLLQIDDYRGIHPDLLVVTQVKYGSLSECAASLRAAAALAREKDRTRILFEHPPAPCGKRYEIHASPETAFTALARTCGAEVRLQGADPENGAIPDADWIKVLDAAALVGQVIDSRAKAPPLGPPRTVHGGEEERGNTLPNATVALETDAGAVTIASRKGQVAAHAGIAPGERALHWPSSALAQLVTGYRSADTLAQLLGLELPPEARSLLSALFPPCWRFSRNESWTFRS
jgi:hypothetical protein